MLIPAAVGAEEDPFSRLEPCALFTQEEAGTAIGRPTTSPQQWVSIIIIGPQYDFNCNFRTYASDENREIAFDVGGNFQPRFRRALDNPSYVAIGGLGEKASWHFFDGTVGPASADGSTTRSYAPYGELLVATAKVGFVITIRGVSDKEKTLNDAKALATLVLTKF